MFYSHGDHEKERNGWIISERASERSAMQSFARLKNRRSPNTRGARAGDGDDGAACDCDCDEGRPGLRAAAAAKDGTAVLAVGATRACEGGHASYFWFEIDSCRCESLRRDEAGEATKRKPCILAGSGQIQDVSGSLLPCCTLAATRDAEHLCRRLQMIS
jgi:hypothetical protein